MGFRGSLSLITPSYGPDLARCELLVESVRACAPGLRHYLVVDDRDHSAFAHLESSLTTIVRSEDLIPSWLRRVPGTRYWLSTKTRPVRGWMLQQLLKISMAAQSSDDLVAFCDSDVAFVRRFEADQLLVGDQPGLLDVDYRSNEVDRWTAIACELIGVAPANVPVRGHVGNLITWRPDVVRSMVHRIETTHQRTWQAAVLSHPTVSEYVLYGVYVRACLGWEASGQLPSQVPLVKPNWGIDLSVDGGLDDFFAGLEREAVAVMIHSKDGVEPDLYRSRVAASWPGTTRP